MNGVELAIYCADIGSIKNEKFGWAVVHGQHTQTGKKIHKLVDKVTESLASGVKVALGFECPLWVPVPNNPLDLTAARKVDGNRPWSAGAGPSVLVTGLTETAWILYKIRLGLKEKKGVSCPSAYLDWTDFTSADTGMFLWEAFVTGEAKATGAGADKGEHAADALIACEAFATRLTNPPVESDCEPSYAVRSLIGGALLWSGWAKEPALIRKRCLVVKPTGPAT